MAFIKREEDFICEVCGTYVRGNGYTNHCPNCLWSKHVDVDPGDRANDCGGLMEPVGVEIKGGEIVIVHRCTECGQIRRNRRQKEDNFEEILKLIEGRQLL